MKGTIYNSLYIPTPISKQNANSAGYADDYAPKKIVTTNKIVESKVTTVSCPKCNAVINKKNFTKHLKKIHNETESGWVYAEATASLNKHKLETLNQVIKLIITEIGNDAGKKSWQEIGKQYGWLKE